jgi:anthranilate phosphoribosyltransferase
MQQVLQGQPSDLMQATQWNAGFYLWRSGTCLDLATGFETAATLLNSGAVAQHLSKLQYLAANLGEI